MSRYNRFVCAGKCPHCGFQSDLWFQADVGVLQWDTLHVGDDLRSQQISLKKPAYGPTKEAWESGKDLWAVGVAVCEKCGASVQARIKVQEGVFRGCDIVDSTVVEADAWGFLE